MRTTGKTVLPAACLGKRSGQSILDFHRRFDLQLHPTQVLYQGGQHHDLLMTGGLS